MEGFGGGLLIVVPRIREVALFILFFRCFVWGWGAFILKVFRVQGPGGSIFRTVACPIRDPGAPTS